jgi:chromosome segregation ATPase
MAYPTSHLFESLGKPIKDTYGRSIGKVASFVVTPNGHINEIFVEHGDNEIFRYTSEQIRIDEKGITLFSPLKIKVETLCNEIPLIWRKKQAIRDLIEKKKVPLEQSEELHSVFEETLNQLKADAQAVMEEIDKQIAACAQRIKDLNIALINLEIEHEIGQVSESAYETAFGTIQENRKCITTEKEDLETMKNKLSNLLLGETAPQINVPAIPEPQKIPEEAEAVSSSLPEPPVIVYVKNVNTKPES